MNCLYCHEPVEDYGPTFPRSVHLACVATWHDELEVMERAVFSASIPTGKTIEFPRWANLAPQSTEPHG